MYQEVKEKIKVMAIFSGGKVIPKVFKWSGRDYKVSNINIIYEEREGKAINYFFSVTCMSGGVFKLKYSDIKLIWVLEEYWVE
jgi:hypothetical protein